MSEIEELKAKLVLMERQLAEAMARAEDMKQRNAKLRQERVDYYNGSALEAANNEITELEGQADALYATVCQRDALLANLAAKESQLRESQLAVVALREALNASYQLWVGAPLEAFESNEDAIKAIRKALQDTQSLAAQRKREIEKKALENALAALGDNPCIFYEVSPKGLFAWRKNSIRAAILGEKEDQ